MREEGEEDHLHRKQEVKLTKTVLLLSPLTYKQAESY